MLKSPLDYIAYVKIGKRVIDMLSSSLALDKIALTKQLQLMGHGRLSHLEARGYFANAKLRAVKQSQYPHARALREELEEFRKREHKLTVRHGYVHIAEGMLADMIPYMLFVFFAHIFLQKQMNS